MSKRGINVAIGTEPKTFRFTLNALAALEDALGRPVLELGNAKFGFKDHRAFVWAGLLHEEPKLTLSQAGDLLDPLMEDMEQYNDVIAKALDAFRLAFPEAKKAAEGEPPNVQSVAGTGTTSNS